MREKRFHLLHIVAAVALTFAVTLGGVALAAWIFIGPSGLTLLEGMGLVNTLFVGSYEQQDVVDAAMYGMVEGLDDRWSYYLNPEHYTLTTQQRQNVYVGIGVTVTYEEADGLLVQAVEPGGPADKAGIVPGELILSADGTSLAGEGQAQGAALIQGEAGTTVTLELRGSDGAVRTLSVKRGRWRHSRSLTRCCRKTWVILR